MKLIKINSKKFGIKIIKLDEEDYEILNDFNWHLLKSEYTFYAVTNVYNSNNKKTTVSMHRLIMNAQSGEYVDQKNHNGLDNRKKNLRICTNGENTRNRIKVDKSTFSIYKGVIFHQDAWRAGLTFNKEKFFLGCFEIEEEAAIAYNGGALKYFGEFAYLNAVPENKDLWVQTSS